MNVVFREVTEEDRKQVTEWIAADASHHGIVDPDFYLHGNSNSSVYALGDGEGTAFYVRQEAHGEMVRMFIQFGPDKRRILEVFEQAYPIVKQDAQLRGFKSILFSTCSPTMVRWMTRFGFVFYGKVEI